MKGRKNHKASGGPATGTDMKEPSPSDVYAGGSSNVVKEARERKKGGKVGMKVMGGNKRHRLDRPGRKRGGGVGSDSRPLSSAANASAPAGRSLESDSK
jgi:hypothetical protein